MKFLHQDTNGMIVEVDVVCFLDGEVESSPIGVDQLNHTIGEVRVTAFDVSDNVDKGFADINDLLIEIPMIVVHDHDLDNVFVDWAEAALGTLRIRTDTY